MKKLVRILSVLTVACLFLFTVGCDAEGGYGGAIKGDYAPGDYGTSTDGADPDDPENGGQSYIRKQLTAAEWNDAASYDYWLSLFSQENGQTKGGIFSAFAFADRGLSSRNMRTVTVKFGDMAVAGAKVRLLCGDKTLYEAVTDASGKAYVFGAGATAVQVESGPYSIGMPMPEDGQDAVEVELAGALAKNNEIEIAFVVDTTGSMGDELQFLKKELEGVVRRVINNLEARVKLGMVFYRDKGDEYVTRTFDFVDANDDGLSDMLKKLNNQTAGGGGDYAEAVDAALEQAVNMQWSSGTSTKLLFHVLDAPYHDNSGSQKSFANSVLSAAKNGIRIIPVAASGLDDLGQYIMRSAALLTGGTYAFLTDDSGVGDSHDEPEVGGYTVEYLSDLMVRLVIGYHTGSMPKAVDWRLSSSVA